MANNIKLCYIYCENEEDKNKEINLDNKLEFKWTESQLIITRKKNYIKNFYANNINNFNLIIGKNGSGKTYCLKKIIKSVHSLQGKMIKIMEVNEIYYVFYWNGFEFEKIIDEAGIGINNLKFESYECDEYGIGKIDINSEHYKSLQDKACGYHTIFFTNQFSISTQDFETILEGIYDPYNSGLKHLLRFPEKMFGKKFEASSNAVNLYDNYFYYTLAKFFCENESKEILDGFNLEIKQEMEIIKTNFSRLNSNINNLVISLKYGHRKRMNLENLIHKMKLMNVNNIVFISILDTILRRIERIEYYNRTSVIDHKEELINKTFNWLTVIDTSCENTYYYVKKLEELKKIYNEFIKITEEVYEESFNMYNISIIERGINLLKFIDDFDILRIENTNYTFTASIKLNDENKDIIKEILYMISSTIDEHRLYFSYNFNGTQLSSGEESLLSMFSRINFATEEIMKINDSDEFEEKSKKKIKSLIILLDEPDIYLHPEWQRTLLNYIFKYIKKKFCDINIQLIVTSNSPILAGDIPRKDIVFLGNEEVGKEETFSKNLLSLFKETFFMKSVLGEFSTEKIKNIIDDIKNGNKKNKEIQEKIINIIAEPVIKRKIKKLFDDLHSDEMNGIEYKIIENAINMGLNNEQIKELTKRTEEEINEIRLTLV